ncbi:MAG TPA: MFS transporter [Candidatus Nanopelagicales bacterium]|nr:MFS transporter [Candidatus Nanopelagicales bacterium]
MSLILDRIAPPRMGPGFRWLLGATWVSNVGDGLALAAGPLLVASQTSNAVLVALAAALQRVPWLLLGLYAGAIADRVDRRRLVMAADGARAVVVALLCVALATGRVSIALVLVTMLLLGVAEVFANTTTSTLLPMLVEPADLGVGNARLQGGFLVANQIVGPPLGAFLFAIGSVWPFAAQAVFVALSVLLIARIATPKGPVRDLEGTHVLRDIAEGVRWLVHHDAVRTLAIVIVSFNITWGAAWSVLVLYALGHLHMDAVGYGLLTTAAAFGGLTSTFGYGWIERHVDLATVMRVCLLLEVMSHAAFALTTNGAVAMVIMVVFGAYAFVWSAVSNSVRQRATPMALQGRVTSVYSVCVFGGVVIGQLLGGWIAERYGLTAPFWFAFVGAGITLALVWRQLSYVAHVQAAED